MDLHAFVPRSRVLDPEVDGPLQGMRIAVKDLFAVREHVSSFGHAVWRETSEPAADHAPVVAATLAAGARVVGLTKLDQLAYSLVGNVGEGEAPVNPFRPGSFCGGSSSGTASAVAGGLADVGIGTDTAGSIRIPAAVCGLHGLRPTHGDINIAGAVPLAASFDTVGLCAASLDPLRQLYATLVGGTSSANFRRVLAPASLDSVLGAAATREVVEEVAGGLGMPVTHVDVTRFTSAGAGDLLGRVQGREIWVTHGAWVEVHGRHLAADVRARLGRCEAFSADGGDTIDRSRRDDYTRRLVELLSYDGVLVLPAMPEARPGRTWSDSHLAAWRTACVRLTAASSLSGLPQLVLRLPDALVRDDVTSVSLLGPRGSDAALIELAQRWEAAADR